MQIKQKLTLKNISLVLLFIFVVLQFFRIEKSNPSSDPAQDLITISQPDEETARLLKITCYDCHSNKVIYPWYTNIAPFSWWIKQHVNEGRDEFNMSEWGSFSEKRKNKKIKESVEMLEEEKMPLASYTWLHGEAKLSEAQKEKLCEFFKTLRTGESDKPKE